MADQDAQVSSFDFQPRDKFRLDPFAHQQSRC